MNNFLFDVKIFAAIRVTARNEHEARAILAGVLNCADANFGSFPDGSPVLGEASMDGEPELVDEYE